MPQYDAVPDGTFLEAQKARSSTRSCRSAAMIDSICIEQIAVFPPLLLPLKFANRNCLDMTKERNSDESKDWRGGERSEDVIPRATITNDDSEGDDHWNVIVGRRKTGTRRKVKKKRN